jgi:hypothetical protein
VYARLLLCPPNEVWETYCVCSVSYYYSSSFFLSFFLSFFRQKFIWHISRRLLNRNQWNFTGMLSTMSRCAAWMFYKSLEWRSINIFSLQLSSRVSLYIQRGGWIVLLCIKFCNKSITSINVTLY